MQILRRLSRSAKDQARVHAGHSFAPPSPFLRTRNAARKQWTANECECDCSGLATLRRRCGAALARARSFCPWGTFAVQSGDSQSMHGGMLDNAGGSAEDRTWKILKDVAAGHWLVE
ncbi:hypothetical protein FH972_022750 [Carpinus fangiana]|uniref:Uncharacterized protein n=1 Tax=Carpinus fangiana TaxID=176857 RepID=A0A5N6KTH1_9ROSI|nr:hypothetical protein FH972_022750 [Carpinus fangiana]